MSIGRERTEDGLPPLVRADPDVGIGKPDTTTLIQLAEQHVSTTRGMVSQLEERRKVLKAELEKIDSCLRQLGWNPPATSR